MNFNESWICLDVVTVDVCLTLACSSVNPTRFRPLSGRSETCCSFTIPPSVLFDVWTKGASSATVTATKRYIVLATITNTQRFRNCGCGQSGAIKCIVQSILHTIRHLVQKRVETWGDKLLVFVTHRFIVGFAGTPATTVRRRGLRPSPISV